MFRGLVGFDVVRLWFCCDSVMLPSWLYRTVIPRVVPRVVLCVVPRLVVFVVPRMVPRVVLFVVPHVVSAGARFRSISFSQRAITKSIIAPVNGQAPRRLSLFEIRRHSVTAFFVYRRTIVYTGPFARPFACTPQSFTGAALLVGK